MALSTLLSDRRLPVVATAAMALSMAGSVPSFDPTRPDPGVYLDAVHRMRSGAGYYDAMDAALRAGGIGPVESTRAFRLPTWFELARLTPNDRVLWWCFLLVTVATVAVLSRVVQRPLASLGAGAVLLFIGLDGFTFPDVWAVPLVAVAMWAVQRQRWGVAVGAAALATSVREVAVLVLVAVVVCAAVRARSWWPALVAVAGLGLLAYGHAEAVSQHLVAAGSGREAAFAGSSKGISSVFDLATAWVPGGWWVGLPLYAVAVWRLRTLGLGTAAGPWLALPLVGVIAHRPEWGALVVPLAVAFGIDGVAAGVAHRRARVGRRPHHAPASTGGAGQPASQRGADVPTMANTEAS